MGETKSEQQNCINYIHNDFFVDLYKSFIEIIISIKPLLIGLRV